MTIVDVPAYRYHADDLGNEQPSLSASMVNILCTKSPLHAWVAHPRLNPDFQRRDEQKFDVGSAVHSLFLEGKDAVDVVAADDWRTKEAKQARDEARVAGRIPLLTAQWDECTRMILAIYEQLASFDVAPPLFADGKPEQTIVWDENGVTCRARLDWLRDDRRACDDLKTTSRSAHPEAYSRALFNVGGDVQAAFYLRGIAHLTGLEATFRWCVVECQPPYALSVISPGPAVLDLANRKVDHALEVWKRCLESGEWPAYTTRVAYAELPAYEESRWLEREVMEEATA